jgi:hypothetical protein
MADLGKLEHAVATQLSQNKPAVRHSTRITARLIVIILYLPPCEWGRPAAPFCTLVSASETTLADVIRGRLCSLVLIESVVGLVA